MASGNITTRTNLTTPQPTMLLYGALSPFAITDDRKITANALFQEITQNITDLSVQFADGDGTATVSAAGKGKLIYNDTTKTFQVSVDGGAYASLVPGGTPGSPLNSVQFNNAGAFGGNANFLYTPSSNPNLILTSVAAGNTALNIVGTNSGAGCVIGPMTAAGVSDAVIGAGASLVIAGDGGSSSFGGISIISIQGSGGPYLFLANSNGTLAVPTAIVSTNILGLIDFWGYGATQYVQGAALTALAEGTFTDTSSPSSLLLYTGSIGSVFPSARLKANSTADILFGVTLESGPESFKFASSTGIATFGKASTQTGQLTFAVSGSANTQSFQAGTSPAASNIYRWPNADPGSGEVLSASAPAAGIVTLSWAAASSGTVTSVSFTGGLISVATATTTPALTVAGTSGGIPYFSSTSTWASSALLDANALMIGGGAGVAPATTATGTGVVTALGVNVGSAGAFVVNGGALGTPSSGTLTNATGLPPTTGIVGWPANASGVLTNNGSGTLSWAAAGSGLTVGTTTITSGSAGRVLYETSGNVLGEISTLTSDGTLIAFAPTVTTGTGATAGVRGTANSLTTGNAFEFSSSSVSSGNVFSIAATGTAAASNTKTALSVATSGANATTTQTTFGGQFSNTSTGTGAVNVGIMATSSGGASNYAVQLGDGSQSSEFLRANISGANDPSLEFSNSAISIRAAGSTVSHYISTSSLTMDSSIVFGWDSAAADSSPDTTLRRHAAAVIRVGGSSTNSGSLLIGASTDTLTGAFTVLSSSAATNTVADLARFGVSSSGSVSAGFGGQLSYTAESSTTNDTLIGLTSWSWVVATHASRTGRIVHSVYDTAAREGFRIEASGSAPMIGFLGAAAVVRQTVSAAATDPATTQTLANDLRTALINLGLCV